MTVVMEYPNFVTTALYFGCDQEAVISEAQYPTSDVPTEILWSRLVPKKKANTSDFCSRKAPYTVKRAFDSSDDLFERKGRA